MAASTNVGSKFIVLIAIDGSDHSFHAYDWFMDNIFMPGTEILIAHCPDYRNFIRTPVMSTDATIVSKMVEQTEAEVQRIIEQIKSKMGGAKVNAKLLRLTGEAGSAIVHAANEHKANCIVTGTRGLGTVRRTLIGSVSNYVLHHSHCPVLIVPTKHDKK